MYKKSFNLFEACFYLFFTLSRKKYKLKSIFDIILGLSTSSIINIISIDSSLVIWFIFIILIIKKILKKKDNLYKYILFIFTIL